MVTGLDPSDQAEMLTMSHVGMTELTQGQS